MIGAAVLGDTDNPNLEVTTYGNNYYLMATGILCVELSFCIVIFKSTWNNR
jgi:hypothetical protein